ncbi:hypothetical protein BS78_09G255500 [Paspalum vaginatum]|nr:hypothetical protein BS78_09G255500 [Paspalum vaginatum]
MRVDARSARAAIASTASNSARASGSDPSSEAGSLPSLIFFFGNNRFDCSRSASFSVFRNPRGAMMNWHKQSLFGDVVYMIQN